MRENCRGNLDSQIECSGENLPSVEVKDTPSRRCSTKKVGFLAGQKTDFLG